MRCDYRASVLPRTLASPYFGRKPKAKVATILVKKIRISYSDELLGLGFLLHLSHPNLQLPKIKGRKKWKYEWEAREVMVVIQGLFSITKDRRFRRKEKGVRKGSSKMGKGEK
jgi:hypothetical protein